MKSIETRLKALEENLTPKQVVLELLQRMTRFDTLEAYADWSYSKEGIAEITKMRSCMYDAAKRRQKGTSLNQACLMACREFCFYYDLAWTPWRRITANYPRYLYFGGRLADLLIPCLEYEALLEERRAFRELATAFLQELLTEKELEKAISSGCFNGYPLLIPKNRLFLDDIISRVTGMIEDFNAHVKYACFKSEYPENWIQEEEINLAENTYPEEWKVLLIDPPSIQTQAKVEAQRMLGQIQRYAKLNVYESERRFEGAGKFFRNSILPYRDQADLVEKH